MVTNRPALHGIFESQKSMEKDFGEQHSYPSTKRVRLIMLEKLWNPCTSREAPSLVCSLQHLYFFTLNNRIIVCIVKIGLLKSIAEKGMKGKPLPPPAVYKRQDPRTVPETVKYLWYQVQGGDKEEFLRLVDDNIFYEDFNYQTPFIGKQAVSAFVDEFNFPGITFVPGRISDGKDSCCFTFEVKIAGVEATTKGVSFYARNPQNGKLAYIRDIPEPAIKPPPLQSLASFLNPGLRRFQPVK